MNHISWTVGRVSSISGAKHGCVSLSQTMVSSPINLKTTYCVTAYCISGVNNVWNKIKPTYLCIYIYYTIIYIYICSRTIEVYCSSFVCVLSENSVPLNQPKSAGRSYMSIWRVFPILSHTTTYVYVWYSPSYPLFVPSKMDCPISEAQLCSPMAALKVTTFTGRATRSKCRARCHWVAFSKVPGRCWWLWRNHQEEH